jgi:hypothetical protein
LTDFFSTITINQKMIKQNAQKDVASNKKGAAAAAAQEDEDEDDDEVLKNHDLCSRDASDSRVV